MARTEADHGAQILVYQSEDTTFQGSWEPARHASLAAVRARAASWRGSRRGTSAQLSSTSPFRLLTRPTTATATTSRYIPIVCAGLTLIALVACIRLRLLANPVT